MLKLKKTLPKNRENEVRSTSNEKLHSNLNNGLLQDIKFLAIKIVGIVLVAIFILTVPFGIYRSSEMDMYPAIKDGDLVIFDRMDKNYVKSDVILLQYKGNKQARRVVAIAGDEVNITEEGLFINGYLQQEHDIYEKTRRYDNDVEFPIRLKKGEVFVLGDGRQNATDSRVYGRVRIKDTLGKSMTIIRRRGI